MAKNYKLEPEAKEDIKEIAIWYEDKKEGLGSEFIESVIDKINFITKKPDAYSIFHDEYRKAPIKKFPYYIFYVIKESIISFVGLFHKSST